MDPSLIFLVLVFGALYMFMIRPQQKRVRAHHALLRSLEEGDVVVTSSGIHGAVVEVEESVVWLEVAPDIELKITRSAVTERYEQADLDPDEPDSEDSEQPAGDES